MIVIPRRDRPQPVPSARRTQSSNRAISALASTCAASRRSPKSINRSLGMYRRIASRQSCRPASGRTTRALASTPI